MVKISFMLFISCALSCVVIASGKVLYKNTPTIVVVNSGGARATAGSVVRKMLRSLRELRQVLATLAGLLAVSVGHRGPYVPDYDGSGSGRQIPVFPS